MSVLKDILAGLTGPVADYMKARAETKSRERIRKLELEEAIHDRRVQLVSQGLAADATWELEQIKNSGWKDEWVLLLLSIPLIGCFIPATANYILRGFYVLESTPKWYQWLILVIFTAVYGIRIYRRQQSDT